MNEKTRTTLNQNHQLPDKAKERRLIEFEKTLSDSVANRVNELVGEGRLHLPADYSVGNALNSAWFKILATKDKNGRPALEVCTKESIANALLEMCILGLTPAKDQGYFIPYGNQLTWFTSVFGKCAALKRIRGIENEPIATVIYEGDEIVLGHNELGEELVLEHKTSWSNKVKNVLVGVYATVMYKSIRRSAVLTKQECLEAWSKSISNKEHKEFTGEFMKRTAINRLVKMILKTTTDSDLLVETIITNEQQHYDFEAEVVETTEEKAKREIAMNANAGKVIDIPKPEPKPETPKADVPDRITVNDLDDIPTEDNPF